MKKSGSATRRGRNSPVLWAKTTKQVGLAPVASEPTSPKVTCAGQIKVKPRIGGTQGRGGACRSWQSVVEEIEKIHHSDGKNKRRPNRARESSGFINKEIMQFLACLRNLRLNFRCFGAFPETGTVSDDEDDGENGAEEEEEEWEDNSKAVFSSWFMLLQEKKDAEAKTHQEEPGKKRRGGRSWDDGAFAAAAAPPPANALRLMRCRSAPDKSWLEAVKEEQEAESNETPPRDREDQKWKPDEGKKKLRLLIDEEKREEEEERKKKQSMLMEAYGDADHCKMSSEIAKETWVLGGIGEALPRSWSSKS